MRIGDCRELSAWTPVLAFLIFVGQKASKLLGYLGKQVKGRRVWYEPM